MEDLSHRKKVFVRDSSAQIESANDVTESISASFVHADSQFLGDAEAGCLSGI